MLALMKRLTNSVFGKLILVIIIVGMAFFGVDAIVNQIRGGLGANIAQAGSRGFDPAALDRRVEAVLSNMNRTAEKPMTKAEALDNGLIDEVLASETSRITLLGFAANLGIAPSTEAVLKQTAAIEAFQNPLTGELDPVLLRQRLRQLGFTLDEFEDQISDDIAIQIMQTAASAAVTSPDSINSLQVRYFGERRNVSWFLFDALAGAPPVNPSAEDVEAYYASHLDAFKRPERRGIDLLRMSVEDFVGEVTVTDQEIATIYEATKSERFSDPDQRTFVELTFANRDQAREAFGLLAGGADPSTVQGAMTSELRTGRAADFADAALRDAMFGAGRQSGAMFGPREVNGRWVVARLISVQPGAVKPLEEVSGAIRDELARERAQVAFTAKMDRLDELLAAGYDLEQISADLKVPVFSFAPVDANLFTESGIQFGALSEGRDAVKQAFRLKSGELTSRFDIGEAIYIAATREIIPESTPALAEITDEVRGALIAQKQNEASQAAVEALIERLASGGSTFTAEAQAAGSPLESLPEPVTRATANQVGLPGPIQQAMFKTGLGETVSLPTGLANTFVILQVNAIEPPSTTAAEGLRSEVAAATANLLRQDLAQALLSEVSRTLKVRTNQTALDAYKRSVSSDQ